MTHVIKQKTLYIKKSGQLKSQKKEQHKKFKIKRQQRILVLKAKLKRIKTLIKNKNQKIKKRKKTIHYKLGLNNKTKNNETFIKNSKKKIKNHKNKYQILNIKT